jgi:crotonobetainyl-CoA:carnitine CoA-transferase CaiB-like acyl-CoA transferase
MMSPLAGVRVLDLTDASGAFCGALLRDLGAQVLRGGTLPDEGIDAVVVSGTPLALARRELAPHLLLERHPHLIVAAISPFGLCGPRAEWRSCDTVAQALGGMLLVNGHAHEPPLPALGAQAYAAAGTHAAIGVVLALLARRQSGRGQVVDVSLQESAAAAVEHVTALYRERGVLAARRGTLHWTGAFRVAECADGPVLLSSLGDWTALLEWLKADRAAQDLTEPRWSDAEYRRAESTRVLDVLAQWAARYRVAELVAQAQLRCLPFAPVWPLERVADHPQLWARGFFVRNQAGAAIRAGGPFRFMECGSLLPLWGGRGTGPESGPPHPPQSGGEPPHSKARASARTARRVLDGVRVLDFTWVVAGPLGTRVLADHGAEVIKIERLDAADGPQRRGGLFGHLNRGKRSLAVDLSDARGLTLMRELACRCDVVIDNFSPRVMANWGLGAAALHALEPRLIVLNLSGFGADGPFANHVSYGPTLQAQTGFTWHMRRSGGAPAGFGFSYSDMVSGYCAALAVVAALWRRADSGVGCAIDLAQLEVLATMLAPLIDRVLAGGVIPDALVDAGADGAIAPHGVYRCRDEAGRERWVALAVRDDAEWSRFAAAIGSPEWARTAQFDTAAARLANAGALDGLIEAWTSTRPAESVMQSVQQADIAAGVVADARDLLADPQLTARGYWVECRDGTQLDGVVPRLSATPGTVTASGPRLGEHTDEVLRDLLAMEQSALDRLRRDGVIR